MRRRPSPVPLLALLLGFLTGCLWAGVAAVSDHVQETAHSCACSPDGKAGLRPCGSDGAYFCCNDCGKRCSMFPKDAEGAASAEPPVPIPTPCKAHCEKTRGCAAGECCRRCGHACLDL